MHNEAPLPRHRLWPWYIVHFNAFSGGDYCRTTARSKDDAASIAYHRHMQPGIRIISVEFDKLNIPNRQMLGQA